MKGRDWGREQPQAKEKALWFLCGLWGHWLALLILLRTYAQVPKASLVSR